MQCSPSYEGIKNKEEPLRGRNAEFQKKKNRRGAGGAATSLCTSWQRNGKGSRSDCSRRSYGDRLLED